MPRISFDFVGRDNLSGAIKSAKANLKSLETEGKQLDAAYKKVATTLLKFGTDVRHLDATIQREKAQMTIRRNEMQSAIGSYAGLRSSTKASASAIQEAKDKMELAIARYKEMRAAIDENEQRLRALNVTTQDSKDLFGEIQERILDTAAAFLKARSNLSGLEGALQNANTAS